MPANIANAKLEGANLKGRVTLDLDASMIEGKDMEETLNINIKYLVDVLHVDAATV